MSFRGAYCVYIESKEILLLIGGTKGSLLQHESFGIWRYCLRKKEWMEIKAFSSFNLEYVKCALSANEKFVIIAGGTKISNDMSSDNILSAASINNKIFVLDISDDNDYKLRESAINSPTHLSAIVIMGGEIEYELLVIGWIKKLFKTKGC